MGKTTIEWTEYSYNPVTGCSHAGSPGCDHCYARRMARRLAGRCGYPEAPNHFDVTVHPDRLEQPLKWRKPRMVFVCSMSDPFHEDVPFEFVRAVFNVMETAHKHIFQVLTKRPRRMLEFMTGERFSVRGYMAPLANVWLGVSVENQATADERREYLRQTPAAIKYVSYEPALGPVDWTGWEFVYQIISGGESGPKARPSHPDWHRATRDFCQKHDIAYFFKQWGRNAPIGRNQWGGWTTQTEEPIHWLDKTVRVAGYEFAPIGKKRAGRLLDGQEWNEIPQTD